MSQKALKLALEALKDNQHLVADNERHAYVMEYNAIIEKLEEALAKQEQGEPKQEDYLSKAYRLANELKCHLAIAPASQQRTWVGLTDDDLEPLCNEWRIIFGSWTYEFAKAIEAKLKEKNT